MLKFLILTAIPLVFSRSDCSQYDRVVSPASAVDVVITASGFKASQSKPVILTVTVTNPGRSPVMLGVGSSSCQLGSIVRVKSRWEYVLDIRTCTADYVEHWLGAGESRSESWGWNGEIVVRGVRESLQPGKYLVKGKVGKWTSRHSIEIEVVDE